MHRVNVGHRQCGLGYLDIDLATKYARYDLWQCEGQPPHPSEEATMRDASRCVRAVLLLVLVSVAHAHESLAFTTWLDLDLAARQAGDESPRCWRR